MNSITVTVNGIYTITRDSSLPHTGEKFTYTDLGSFFLFICFFFKLIRNAATVDR